MRLKRIMTIEWQKWKKRKGPFINKLGENIKGNLNKKKRPSDKETSKNRQKKMRSSDNTNLVLKC